MIDGAYVRQKVSQYVWVAVRQAQVDPVTTESCRRMVDLIVTTFFAVNPGLLEFVVKRVNEASTARHHARKKTWANRLRRAVVVSMDCLYVELDLVDAYLNAAGNPIGCEAVLGNQDCIAQAMHAAGPVSRSRRRLVGWLWFDAA